MKVSEDGFTGEERAWDCMSKYSSYYLDEKKSKKASGRMVYFWACGVWRKLFSWIGSVYSWLRW